MVQLTVGDMKLRVLCGYGPQETDSPERKALFWSRVHAEVNIAEEEGAEIIILMDGNLHPGDHIVPGATHPQNYNGRLFEQFLQNNTDLTLLNSSEVCEGKITRQRKKGNKIEESILDFALTSSQLTPFCTKMTIDESRQYAMSSYLNKKVTHSDHFTIILQFSIKYRRKRPQREEYFNFRNCQDLQEFGRILESESSLTECFNNSEPFPVQLKSGPEHSKIFTPVCLLRLESQTK